MPTEEERIAADEARIAALAGGGPDDAPGDDNDETMASSTVPTDDEDAAPTDEEIRAANDAGDVDPDAEPGEPDPDAEPEPDAEAPPAPGASTFQRRISQLAGDKRTLKQQLADAQAEVARLKAGQQADPPANPEPGADAPQRRNFSTQAEFDAAVAAEASRRAAVTAFNNRCNEVEAKGAKAFGTAWGAAKEALSLLDDDGTIPSDLLLPALETENPHRVILALGQDPDLAARLLAMNPIKRAIEIARMDLPTAPTPPRRSAAPPPVDPIRGRAPPAASSSLPSDKDSDAEWLRKRNAQVAAREAARPAG